MNVSHNKRALSRANPLANVDNIYPLPFDDANSSAELFFAHSGKKIATEMIISSTLAEHATRLKSRQLKAVNEEKLHIFLSLSFSPRDGEKKEKQFSADFKNLREWSLVAVV